MAVSRIFKYLGAINIRKRERERDIERGPLPATTATHHNNLSHIRSNCTMLQESPQKKRKTDRGVKNYSEESSNDGTSSSSGEEMDIETSNGHPASNDNSSRSNDQKMGKKRAANGSATALDDTAILSQMYEYKSNVFRMETEELLAEVKLDYQKRMGPVEKVLHKLKNIIDTLPAKEPAIVSVN